MSQNIQFISKEEIRNLFNEYILPEKTKGNLFEIVKEDKHPARNLAGEPFCTRSQYVVYYDRNNKEIARVHQYLLRKLGASGNQTPKELL